MDAEVLVEDLVEVVADKPVRFVIMDQAMADLVEAVEAKAAKGAKGVMEPEVLLEFILTTTVQMVIFGIVSFRLVQQEQVVSAVMEVLAVTEELAGVFKLTVVRKLATAALVVLVALEELEEREAMEPTE
jgi:hypothetical protein